MQEHIAIAPEVPVTFEGIYYNQGYSKATGEFTVLECRFKDKEDREFRDAVWRIEELSRDNLDVVCLKLSQLGRAIYGGEDVWNDPKHIKLSRKSYTKAIADIVKCFNKMRKAKIYLKTIVKFINDEQEHVPMLPNRELLLFDENVIFSHKKGELKYNELEINNLESYGIEVGEVSTIKESSKPNLIRLDDIPMPSQAVGQNIKPNRKFDDLPF